MRGRADRMVSARSSSKLAAQPLGDGVGFADRGPGGMVVVRAQQVLGVDEQAVAR